MLNKREFLCLLRYAGSGILNTLVGVSIIILLTVTGGANPFVANIGGYLVSLSLGFFITKKYVFLSNGHFAVESMRYVFSFSLCFILNLLVLWFALNMLHLNVVTAQLLAAGAYTFTMYLLSRCFVFKVSHFSPKKADGKSRQHH